MEVNQLTEDQTIKVLIQFLVERGWIIESHCLGQTRGYDIVAKRQEESLIIEVKGAKASNSSPTKKREYFDSGQIKTHLGKAIIKSFETQNKFPNAQVGIAHPNNPYLREIIGDLIKNITSSGIIHFWVNENGTVTTEKS